MRQEKRRGDKRQCFYIRPVINRVIAFGNTSWQAFLDIDVANDGYY